MHLALIADIHGNLPALRAVLDDMESVQPDRIVCLGDVAAMGSFPLETIEIVQQLRCPVIMGNGDAAMLRPPSGTEADETARRFAEMDRWSGGKLPAPHLDFIRAFRKTQEVALGDEHFALCFHGSPRSYDEIITSTTPDDELEPLLAGYRADILAGGHWHFQMLRRFREKILFNPGSVGLPYEFDRDGEVFIPARAEYGIIGIENGTLRLEHRRVPYDHSEVVEAMRERGFPHAEWWASNFR